MSSLADGAVTLHLQGDQRIQGDIDHILLRPDGVGIATDTPRRDGDRELVLVVVLFEVGTQTDERRHITGTQVTGGEDILRVDVHLQVVELTEVIRRALVDGTGITIGQIDHLHRHRLLVLLIGLGGHTIGGLTDNARRQHVGNRRTVGVLLIAHRPNVEGALAVVLRRLVVAVLAKTEGVSTPAAAHQLERG